MEQIKVTSDICWLKDRCPRYNAIKNCECRTTNESCIKLEKLTSLYNASMLTQRQREHIIFRPDYGNTSDLSTFKDLSIFEKNIVANINNGKNLYIHSEICGNGKTAWAIRMIQSYLEAIWASADTDCKALFINVPRFLLELKNTISDGPSEYINYIKKNVLTADLVVWDEIATKSITVYEHEHLLSLINARLDAGKSNIYTSNMSPSELAERLGDRLYSRIVNLSQDIYITGSDKRKLVVAE